jgi:hypothetical protein
MSPRSGQWEDLRCPAELEYYVKGRNLRPLDPVAGPIDRLACELRRRAVQISSSARSSAVRRSRAAAMFSSRWSSEPVPGMASITGEFASIQASATCATVAPCRAATLSTRLSSMALPPRPAGRRARTRSRPARTRPGRRRRCARSHGTGSAPRRPVRSPGPRPAAPGPRC